MEGRAVYCLMFTNTVVDLACLGYFWTVRWEISPAREPGMGDWNREILKIGLEAMGVWVEKNVIVVQFTTIFVDILVNQGEFSLIPFL